MDDNIYSINITVTLIHSVMMIHLKDIPEMSMGYEIPDQLKTACLLSSHQQNVCLCGLQHTQFPDHLLD